MSYTAFEGLDYNLVDEVSRHYANRHKASWFPHFTQDMDYPQDLLFDSAIRVKAANHIVTSGSPILTIAAHMLKYRVTLDAAYGMWLERREFHEQPDRIVFLDCKINDRLGIYRDYDLIAKRIVEQIPVCRIQLHTRVPPEQIAADPILNKQVPTKPSYQPDLFRTETWCSSLSMTA